MVNVCKFNDVTDYDITVVPGVIWDDINTFNAEHQDGQMKIKYVEHKYIQITLPSSSNFEDLIIRVKFFKNSVEDDQKIRVRFSRKQGDVQ